VKAVIEMACVSEIFALIALEKRNWSAESAINYLFDNQAAVAMEAERVRISLRL
jgi:hypothetical protein